MAHTGLGASSMTSQDPTASELFADHIGRSSADFEELCARHPEKAEELDQLRGEFQKLLEAKGYLGFSGTLSDELQRRYGEGVDPRVTLDAEAGEESDYRSDMLERLGGRQGAYGRYLLKGEIGRGGQGAVIRVWDEDLRRSLAMKVLHAQGPIFGKPKTDPKKLGRFLEEAQVTGQLDHPGIVPVHELGLDAEGGPYFTMKLVKGENLRNIFRKVREQDVEWGLTRAIAVMLKVCEAVSYAHSKNVVHRDLKPANVMVGRFGEVYVMDWGLARVHGAEATKDIRIRPLGIRDSVTVSEIRTERNQHEPDDSDSPLVTMEGDVVGTPAFMAPEQARGELDKVGPRADVYSIGAMLYELVTGQLPYASSGTRLNNYAILAMVQTGPPVPVERFAKDTPPELLAICRMAMARELDDRYESVADLRSDLQAFVGGRVVKAYDAGRFVEMKKWVQRNRALAAANLAALILLVVSVVFIIIREGLSEDLEIKEGQLQRQGYALNLRAAAWSLESEAYREAEEWLRECPRSRRHWEWEHLALRRDQSIAHWSAHPHAVTGLAFAPSGLWLISTSSGGDIVLWDPEDGSRKDVTFAGTDTAPANASDSPDPQGAAELELDSPPVSEPDPNTQRRDPILSLSYPSGPDHSIVVAGGGDLRAFGVRGDELSTARIPGTRAVHAPVPGTDLVVSLGGSDWMDGTHLPNLALQSIAGVTRWARQVPQAIPLIACTPDGKRFAIGTRRRVELRTVEEGALIASHDVHGDLRSLAFHPSGRQIALGLREGAVELWSLGEGGRVERVERVELGAPVDCLAFSPGGMELVTGLGSGRLSVLTLGPLARVRDLLGHTRGIRSVAFAPDGRRLATGDEGGSISIWLGTGASCVGEFDVVREGTIESIAVSDDGSRVAAVGGGIVRLWNAADAAPLAFFEADTSAFDAAANRLALLRDEEREIVDCTSLDKLATFSGRADAACLIAALAPGLPHVAVAREDGSLDIESFEGEVRTLVEPGDELVRELCYSRDGRTLVAVGGTWVRVFRVDAGALLAEHQLKDGGSGIYQVALDPGGRYVAFSTYVGGGGEFNRSGSMGVLDLYGDAEVELVSSRRVYGRDETVTPVSLAFDPAGDRLACSFNDGSLTLWKCGTWAAKVVSGPSEDWRTITFSPDGKRIWAWTESATGLGVFDATESSSWLLTLPFGSGALRDVTYDAVHRRLLATTSDAKRILFFEASREHARSLWEQVIEREASDRELLARVDSVLIAGALEEVAANREISEAKREAMSARLRWIGDPAGEELNDWAWEAVQPGTETRLAPEELARVVGWARAAVSIEPELAEYRETLSWALFAQGDHEGALREARLAVELATEERREIFDANLEELQRELSGEN